MRVICNNYIIERKTLKGINLVFIVFGTHEIAKIMYHNLLNSPIIYSTFLISHIGLFLFVFLFFWFANLEKIQNSSFFPPNLHYFFPPNISKKICHYSAKICPKKMLVMVMMVFELPLK
jgi:uncharacterized membrane protein (UPF0182 family)